MKSLPGTIYQAFDGERFVTEELCREYEEKNWLQQFVGLDISDVVGALDRDFPELADAFEKIGQRIARKRLADGERRRVVTKREPNVPDNADAQKRVEESRPLISTGDERRETDEVS